jgi:hypothetical protein
LVTPFATSYFPSLSYLGALCKTENAVIDLGEHCKKQTERSRASILTPNGIQKLSVPTIRPFGNKTSTKDVQISFVQSWQRDHRRAIEAAYASSPYFEHYSEGIFSLIDSKIELLHVFNKSILDQSIALLDLPIVLNYSMEFIEDNPIIDFRDFNFDKKSQRYIQVNFGKIEFIPNLSILDALFCFGPMARKLIIP